MTLPTAYDVRNGNRRWGSLGNFYTDDCTIAAFEHLRMVKATTSASSWQKLIYQVGFRPPHTPYTLEIYSQYQVGVGEKPSHTTGVDPGSFFPWAKEQGLILDWGRVTIDTQWNDTFPNPGGLSNVDRLHQAMIDYRGVLLEAFLTPNAYHNWSEPRAWDVGPAPGDTPSEGLGHATALVQYGPANDGVVTWGRVKSQTHAFTQATTFGAFVFLDAQDTLLPNYAELLANIKNL